MLGGKWKLIEGMEAALFFEKKSTDLLKDEHTQPALTFQQEERQH